MKQLLQQLSKNQNIVLVIKSKNYAITFIDLNKETSKKFKRICLIAVSKPYNTLMNQFKNEGIDSNKYYFIDCSSKKEVKESKNCTYISSPQNLTQLAIVLSKTIKNKNIDLVIFDSISTLLLHNDELIVTKFLNNIMANMRAEGNTKAIYTLLQEDLKGPLKTVFLFADKVIES